MRLVEKQLEIADTQECMIECSAGMARINASIEIINGEWYDLVLDFSQRCDTDIVSSIKFHSVRKADILKLSDMFKQLALSKEW